MTVLQITQLNSFYKYLSLEIREKNSQKCALLPIITKFGTQENGQIEPFTWVVAALDPEFAHHSIFFENGKN